MSAKKLSPKPARHERFECRGVMTDLEVESSVHGPITVTLKLRMTTDAETFERLQEAFIRGGHPYQGTIESVTDRELWPVRLREMLDDDRRAPLVVGRRLTVATKEAPRKRTKSR